MTEKYLNLVDGKTYEILSEDDRSVTFKLVHGGKPHYLGRSEFDKRFQLLPASDAPAPVTSVVSIPEGYALVPIEPTEAMLDEGQHVNSEWLNDNAPIGERRYREPAKAVYKAMIALGAAEKGR